MPNTTSTNIVFRTKFKKQIKCDVEHDVFLEAFQKFINMDEDTAINMLWQLTYEPHSEVLWKIGLYPESLDEAITKVLRNELRYQYEEYHPNFLSIKVEGECHEAFTNLSNQADPIVAVVVYSQCSSHLYVHECEMARMLYLLESNKENQFFGGIRSLGFNVPEADYLKSFHEQIYNLLKVLYELHQKQCSSLNTPFEGLAQRIEENGNDLPFDYPDPITGISPVQEPVPESVQCNSAYRRLLAEAVFMHKDVFTSFVQDNDMNALVQLAELGFDLNEVMSKRKMVANLLQAIAEKEKAEQKLFEAHEALNS